MKLEITVAADVDENTGRSKVSILFPKEQGGMSTQNATHLLIAGASLLIKACSKTDTGIKDYELIKEVFEHLNNEFSSIDSFEDLMFKEKLFNKKTK